MGIPHSHSNNSSSSSFGNIFTDSSNEENINKERKYEFLSNFKRSSLMSGLDLKRDNLSQYSSPSSSLTNEMETHWAKSVLFSNYFDSDPISNNYKPVRRNSFTLSTDKMQNIYFPKKKSDLVPKEDIYPIPIEDDFPIPVEDVYQPKIRSQKYADLQTLYNLHAKSCINYEKDSSIDTSIKENSYVKSCSSFHEYDKVYKDPNPIVTLKKSNPIFRNQNVAVKYLKPKLSDKVSNDLTIRQLDDTQSPPYPPLILRITPPRPHTPERLVYHERPPTPPPSKRKIVVVPGRVLPPPPRKLIVEQRPNLPPKTPDILVHKWLDYDAPIRNVYYEKVPNKVSYCMPRNEIIRWETPDVILNRNVSVVGVESVDPQKYAEQFADEFEVYDKMPNEIAKLIERIRPPEGEKLPQRTKYLPKLSTHEQPLFKVNRGILTSQNSLRNISISNKNDYEKKVKETMLDKYIDQVVNLFKLLKFQNENYVSKRENFHFETSFGNKNRVKFRE